MLLEHGSGLLLHQCQFPLLLLELLFAAVLFALQLIRGLSGLIPMAWLHDPLLHQLSKLSMPPEHGPWILLHHCLCFLLLSFES